MTGKLFSTRSVNVWNSLPATVDFNSPSSFAFPASFSIFRWGDTFEQKLEVENCVPLRPITL